MCDDLELSDKWMSILKEEDALRLLARYGIIGRSKDSPFTFSRSFARHSAFDLLPGIGSFLAKVSLPVFSSFWLDEF